MMKRFRLKTLFEVSAFAVCLGSTLCALSDEHPFVTQERMTYLDTNASILWRTITRSNPEIALDWPDKAVRAQLTVDREDGELVRIPLEDHSATSYRLTLPLPTERKGRRVVALSIAYYDEAGNEISAKSVRLGLVDSVGTDVSMNTQLESSVPSWRKTKTGEVVQIPSDTTTFSIDGEEVTGYDSPGWYCLRKDPGTYLLSLLAEGRLISETVTVRPDGLVLVVR